MDIASILLRIDEKKRRLDEARPLPTASVASLLDDFKIRYAHETTALEGNTLSLQETQVVLERGMTIHGKSLREHLEIVNASDAIEWLLETVTPEARTSETVILRIHEILMKGILKDDAGIYRRVPVFIRGANHVPPNWQKISTLMEHFVEQLNSESDTHPLVRAARAHVELAQIHPFVDGNGQTCRMLVNVLLMQHGYPPALYTALQREDYLQTLRDADLGNDSPFVAITAGAVEWTLDRYMLLLDGV